MRFAPLSIFAFLTLGAIAATPSDAAALPVLRVRAETRLELRAEVEGGERLVLQGHLRDDRGAGLRRSPVELALLPQGSDEALHEEEVLTRPDGSFRVELAVRSIPRIRAVLERGEIRATARFRESAHHGAIFVERPIDPSRVPLRLHVEVTGGGAIDLDGDTVRVRIRADSDRGGTGLSVELRSELGELDEQATDDEGVAEFTIDPAQVGPPGSGRLIARSAGDQTRAGAQTEVPIVRVRRATLTLEEAESGRDAQVVHGTLRDSAGPLAAEAVGLYVDDRHFTTVLTDAAGAFQATLPHGEADTARTAEARFDGSGPGHPPAISNSLALPPPPPAGAQLGWVILALVLGGLGMRLATRRRPDTVRDMPELRRRGAELSSGRRIPKTCRVRLEVTSLRDGEAIDAEIAFAGPENWAERTERGVLARELPEGRYRVVVRASGWAPEELEVITPHTGSYSDVRVRLERWRERALRVLRERAMPWLGEDGWQSTTVHALSARADAPDELRELAAEVEPMVYGSEGASAEDLDRLRDESG